MSSAAVLRSLPPPLPLPSSSPPSSSSSSLLSSSSPPSPSSPSASPLSSDSPSPPSAALGCGGGGGVSLSSLSRYVKLEKLGEGNYGAVYKARDNGGEGRVVALKKIKWSCASDDDGVPCTALREMSVLQELRHPHVIPLLDVVFSVDHLYLSFPYYDKDLRRYMDCVGELHPQCVKWYAQQILQGLRHCHERRVLHRDLKPQNLLINRTGDVQLADFGLARSLAHPHTETLTHDVATLWYRAPEILLGQRGYTEAMDLWAVGCVLAELSNDWPLFPGDSEIATLFKIFQVTGTPSESVWPGVSGLADFHWTFPSWPALSLPALQLRFPALDGFGLDLLQRLLTLDPAQRLSAAEALSHPYFDDLNASLARHLSATQAIQLDFNDGTERRKRRHAKR